MAQPVSIYHNPRCSKSRAALALLKERDIEPVVIEYLKTPPTVAELTALVRKLGISAEQLVRKGEEIYESLAKKSMTERQWIAAMVEHPILIERPIVVKGAKAVIGRPVERIDELL